MSRLLVLLFASAVAAFGLDPRTSPAQYSHTAWRVQDGLPSNTVQTLLQTRDGYLWLGTLEGLVRFDGTRFTVFDTTNTPAMKHNSVVALREDRRGVLWIGTSGGGITHYRDGAFSGSFTTTNGLPNNYVRNIYESPSGDILITAHGGGLIRYAQGRFTAEAVDLPTGSLRVVHVDRQGSLWIGTDEDGLAVRRDGKTRLFGKADGIGDGQIRVIFEDSHGRLWVGTRRAGLLLYENGRFRAYTRHDGLPSDDVRHILEDRQGNLWIGTESSGAARYRDGVFARFSSREGLPHNFVRAMLEDRDGNLWMGTRGGLSRLKDKNLLTITTADGLVNDNVRSLLEDRQRRMWFGTSAGLSYMQNGRLQSVAFEDGTPDTVRALAQTRSGVLYAGAAGGLYRSINGTSFAPVPEFRGTSVWSVLEDRAGGIWVGTANGLARREGATNRTYSRDDGLPSNEIQTLAEDRRGTLWVGTAEGLAYLDGDRFRSYTSRDGLAHNVVSAIYADADDTLWIGTRGGLSRYRNGSFRNFRRGDGLLSDDINSIVADDHGYLWLSSPRGVCRLRKNDLEAFAAARLRTLMAASFDTSDGMKSAECNGYSQPSGFKTHDGRVWFPTVHGAVAFDPQNVRQSALPPRVVIERVDAGSRSFPPHSGHVTLPAGTSDMEVQFAALALSGAEGVQFRYRLDGFDKDWVAAGQRRSAFYTNLPPGDFRFRVMAESHAGTAPGQEATLAVRLEPRFIQRPEFLLICVIFAAAAGWAAYRLHVRSIHRRYEAVLAERTRIGREIHDTLMQGVAGITLQIEVAANKLNGSPAEAKKQLDRALTQLDTVLTEARECVLQLRSPSTAADLVETVRHLAAEMSDDRGLPIDVSVEGVPRPLPDPVSRNLLRIVREALSNAAKHSSASHVDMTLRFDSDAVRLQVCDNGKGFDPKALDGRHFGLVGMRERTREAGGAFALDTEPGRGTRVEVAIPDRRGA